MSADAAPGLRSLLPAQFKCTALVHHELYIIRATLMGLYTAFATFFPGNHKYALSLRTFLLHANTLLLVSSGTYWTLTSEMSCTQDLGAKIQLNFLLTIF